MASRTAQSGAGLVSLMLAGAAIAAVLFAILVFWPRPDAFEASREPEPDAVVPAPIAAAPPAVDSAPSSYVAPSGSPSELQPAAPTTVISPPASEHLAAERAREAALKAEKARIRQRLRAVAANPDPEVLDGILADLQTLQPIDGDGPKVDFGAMRKNIQITFEIRDLTQEMGRYANDPENVDRERLQADLDRLTRLQSELLTVGPILVEDPQ